MEENPHISHGGTHSQNNAVDEENNRRRHYNHHAHGGEVKYSGKRYRSWAAAAIADCVAVCCCPCAIIKILTFTFVKVPWMIGRRCLSVKKKKKKKKCGGGGCRVGGEDDDNRFVVERDGSLRKEEEEVKTRSFGGDNDESRISATVEAERVWIELYQIGHLGFGRLSFTGIQ